ncbi:MAG: hypothetical protein A2219_08600 [Elusimicrobia bacterium RIFOXYA2_FULL_50_26]|nr:MAG: hypothetical protein A2219_08600 [Elusimicrobia bacterium RIFOXYA2_FULL_50_26]OGS25065.1 MAG: hypothetical protein A2314_03015 [Elusimicrobia bacterium RIFOXYB2_FULL_50_12]
MNSYPSLTTKVIDKVFGPAIDYVNTYNINGGFIFVILFGLYIYFAIMKKGNSWKNYNWYDKLGIIGFFTILVINIFIQIGMFGIFRK